MVRKKTKPTVPDPNLAPFVGFTANQVVAFNLTQAREWRGWTQDEAAAALEPYLGVRWSKATFSQAERSVAGRFIRNFTADEVVALPAGSPCRSPGSSCPLRRGSLRASSRGWSPPTSPCSASRWGPWSTPCSGDDSQQAMLNVRLDSFLDALGPAGLTAAQGRIASLVAHRVEALVRNAFRDLEEWQTTLRAMANQLEQLERRSKWAMATEVGIKPGELHIPPDDRGGDEEPGPGNHPG